MRPSFLVAAAVLAPAVLAAPALLGAQRAVPAPGPRVGILAGLSSATFGGNDADFESGGGVEKKRRNGFVGGVSLVLPVAGSPISFRPELLYAQKGVRIAGTYHPPSVQNLPTVAVAISEAVKLDYLELPVLLQLDVPNTAGLHPALYIGPSIAYRVRCHVEFESQGTTTSTGCDDADIGLNRKVDVSGVVGGQLGFALGGQSVGVGVRYTHGFTKLGKDVDVKNRAFAVYGTIELPFAR